jgi:VIT1/CCC1 family predicted Fe2+/Mn2+ transporter
MGFRKIHERASYLGDAVFAASDGIITTFAVVAGAIGASLPNSVILILGFANLFADGFSMAAGNYLGNKSATEYELARGDKENNGSPILHGVITFMSFNIIGLIPLLPFVSKTSNKFLLSTSLVALSLFVVGVLRSKYTRKSWVSSGMKTLAVGGFATLVAYTVGYLLDTYLV